MPSVVEKGLLGLAVLLGLLYLSMAVGAGVDDAESNSIGYRVAWGSVSFLSGSAVLAGLWLTTRTPRLGGTLVVLGAFSPIWLLLWTWFIPIVAVVVAAYGVVRARRFARQRPAS